jgi:hypothetical protein
LKLAAYLGGLLGIALLTALVVHSDVSGMPPLAGAQALDSAVHANLQRVVFGNTLGIGAETAIAVSLVKRLREVVYGAASLVSWQWMEGRRLQAPVEHQS